jgi:hypothetical protein
MAGATEHRPITNFVEVPLIATFVLIGVRLKKIEHRKSD